MIYNVFCGTLNLSVSICLSLKYFLADPLCCRWVQMPRIQTWVATCASTRVAAGRGCGLWSRTESCIHSKRV